MVPVLEGGFLHPPVCGAAVVGHNVHYYLQAVGVSFFHELLVKLVVSETGIYVIVVCAGIAVVRLLRLVVEQQGSAPYCSGSEAGDVVQVVHNALDVAAVAGDRIGAVYFVRCFRNPPGAGRAVEIFSALPLLVIVHKGRREAVRHNEVYHIGRGEAFALAAAFLALPYDVRVFEALIAAGEHQVVFSG